MKSKTSLFNRTIFIKNFILYWPLWGFACLLAIIIPVGQLIAVSNSFTDMLPRDYIHSMLNMVISAYPCCIFIYSILVAMAIWNYLNSAKSVALFHSIPVTRASLYLTNALSGLIMVAGPFVINTVILGLSYSFLHGMNPKTIFICLFAALLQSVLFFGLATFVAMLTGNIIALPIIYFIINFLSSITEELLSSLAEGFLFGFQSPNMPFLSAFSPIIQILMHLKVDGNNESILSFEYLILYGLVGILFLIISFVIYRNRKSESAGEVIAFRGLYPFFAILFTLYTATTLGQIFYSIFGFNSRNYNAFAMTICVIIAAIIGFIAAQMILRRAFRIFNKKTFWGMGVATVCSALLCFLLSMDLFGIEKNVPDLNEINSVTLTFNGSEFTVSKPENIANMVTLHKIITENSDNLIDDSYKYNDSYYTTIIYDLKNGNTLNRAYSIYGYDEKQNIPGSCQNKIKEIIETGDFLLDTLNTLGGSGDYKLDGMWIYGFNRSYTLDDKEKYELYNMIIEDLEEGNFTLNSYSEVSQTYQEIEMSFNYQIKGTDYYKNKFLNIPIGDSMVNSIEYINGLNIEYVEDNIYYK